MTHVLEARGVVSGYGDVPILHEVSMELDPGELVTIIGPNGAGKSTLIKTIFGLLDAVEGRIVFDGEDITREPPERIMARGMSYVPQNANTFPTLTVRENLEMGAYLLNVGLSGALSRISTTAVDGVRRAFRLSEIRRWYGRSVTRAYLEQRIDSVLGLFPDLRPYARSRTGKLSGGEQQMVALARALILEPKVLLIDEPSAGLAPRLVDAIFRRIEEIHEAGTGTLLVEQNAKKALAMANRGYVLEMGRNRYAGDAQELLANPEVGRLYLGG